MNLEPGNISPPGGSKPKHFRTLCILFGIVLLGSLGPGVQGQLLLTPGSIPETVRMPEHRAILGRTEDRGCALQECRV